MQSHDDAISPAFAIIAPPPRALNVGPAFWLAMFVASAFGTNIGDYWSDDLGINRATGFAILVAACAALVWGDRRNGRRTEIFYWAAIVGLRAAATNMGDLLTHDLRFSYVLVSLGLGVLTLVAGWFTRAPAGGGGSPLIDGWYWVAMLLAGVFGTVAGDLAAHTIGIYPAVALLTLALLLLLFGRTRLLPASVLSYWCVVLLERTAATPAGDALASRHAAGLGPAIAMACTGTLFAAALLWRQRRSLLERPHR